MDIGEIWFWDWKCRMITHIHAHALEALIYGFPPEEVEEIARANAPGEVSPERLEILHRRAYRFTGRVEVLPQDVMAILSEIGVRATSPVILETFATACTLGAVILQYDRVPGPQGKPRSRGKPRQREANNALATLRRVLPEMIENAEYDNDMRIVEYRELLAQIEKIDKFTCPEPSTKWHSVAQILTGLYRMFVDMGADELPRSGGLRFAQLTLSKLGVNCTRDAIEKALARCAGRAPEDYPSLPKASLPS